MNAAGLPLRIAVLLAVPLLLAAQHPGTTRPSAAAAHAPRTRVYYIAADEVDWNYAPGATNKVTGTPYDFVQPGSQGMLDRTVTTYRKTLYREYTNESFTALKPRGAAWEHLGIMGPLIRAEVGDTIRVVFRNHASRAYSVHPHGVFYAKNAEGAQYVDGSSGADRADDAVAPGATFTYTWLVPERAGPADGDGSTAFWVYHSHVDEGRDVNAGLIGPMIITRRGMARPDGSPVNFDREFVAEFGLYDEHLSWQWDENLRRLYGDPKNYDGKDGDIHDWHHFYTINGFLDATGPTMVMHRGERVRWYLFANTNEEESWDVHTPHWHGQTVTVNHMRMDMVPLTPMVSIVADMVPDNPGTWLFHCHMPGHLGAGMRTTFTVQP